MKKNLYRMFAAILFCGAMTTVFTSCSKDDDDNNGGSTPSGQQAGETNQPTKRDVELNFIAQKNDPAGAKTMTQYYWKICGAEYDEQHS